MLAWLKNILGRKETLVHTVSLGELNDLLSQRHHEDAEIAGQRIRQANSELDDIKNRIREKIAVLEQAQLRNPNIPERAKHYMEGNRQTYIRSVQILNHKLSIPESSTEAREFCLSFPQRLEQFGKSSVRSYSILQEFFANEAKDIAVEVRNLERVIERLHKAVSESNSEIAQIQEKIHRALRLEAHIREQRSAREKDAHEKNHVEQQLANLMRMIKHAMNEQEYQDIMKRRDEKHALQKSTLELMNEISSLFSQIEPALKKYERIAAETGLMGQYLKYPVQAFLEDDRIAISEILENLHGHLHKIDLKDTKRNKIRALLEQHGRQRLQGMRSKLIEMRQKIHHAEEWIEAQEATRKVNELWKQQSALEERKNDLEKSEARSDTTKDERLLSEIYGQIERDASIVMNASIVIKREEF